MTPARVYVGDQKVTMPQVKLEVFVRNTFGKLEGYPSCEITGLSFYWAPAAVLASDAPEGGVAFSKVAVDSLLNMKDQTRVYRIAQDAYDKILRKRGIPNRYDLYPLRRASPVVERTLTIM